MIINLEERYELVMDLGLMGIGKKYMRDWFFYLERSPKLIRLIISRVI